ncbi:MAG: hypothetical protein ACU84Q_19185 [Gammaproteobacteria bacterium]
MAGAVHADHPDPLADTVSGGGYFVRNMGNPAWARDSGDPPNTRNNGHFFPEAQPTLLRQAVVPPPWLTDTLAALIALLVKCGPDGGVGACAMSSRDSTHGFE